MRPLEATRDARRASARQRTEIAEISIVILSRFIAQH